jgi:gliding motility-associated-like protein
MNRHLRSALIFLWAGMLPFALFAQLPPNQPEQDCPNAIPVCQNTYVQPNSYSGEGVNPNEINGGSSCLAGGEVNDVWYIFTVTVSGDLYFLITPASLADDYDWAVYNLTNASCADIATNPALEVSCNFSGTAGATGAALPGAPNSQGAGGTPVNAPIPVLVGETYVLNVSNWSGTGSGYSLDFTPSTAAIFDNIPPVMDTVFAPCGSSTISVQFSENVLCNTVDPTDFTITGPGGPFTVTGVTGANCAIGGTFENVFELSTAPPITQVGAYTVSVVDTILDNCGNVCLFTSEVVVISIPGITATASPAAICSGGTSNLTTSLGAGVGYTFSWMPGGLTTPSISVSPAATTTYTVTATDPVGCSASANVTVTVNPTPNSPFTFASNPICTNQQMVITYTGSGSVMANYIWDFDGAFVIPGTGQGPHTTFWSTPGPKDISLTVVQAGCSSTQTVQVLTVNQVPTSTFSVSNNPICGTQQTTLTYTGNAGPGATYAWDFAGGMAVPTTGPGPILVNWNTSGPKTVTLTVTDNGCTSSTTSVLINVNTVPSSTFTVSPQFLCGTQSANINYTGSGGAGAAFTWNFNGGTAIPGTGPGPHTVSWTTTGTKNISLVVTENGCPSPPTTVSLNVGLQPTSNFSGPSSVCEGDPAQFTYTGNAPSTSFYSWNFSGGVVLNGSGQGPIDVEWLTPGVKQVCLQVDEGGCVSTLTCKNITVTPKPVASIAPVTSQCFNGNSFTFAYTGTVGVNAYSWIFGADATPATSNAANPTGINYQNPGIKTVSLVVTKAGCVSDTATVSFEVIPEPSALFQANTSAVCAGDCFTFTYLGVPFVGQTYSWNFGPNAIPTSSSLQNPGCVTFTNGGAHTVTLIVNYKGCVAARAQQVTVYPTPVVNAGPDKSFCEGTGGVQLNGTISGGTPPFSIQWSCNVPGACGLSSPFVEDPYANPTDTTTYYFQVVDGNGCASNIDSVVVKVKPKPVADAGPDMWICEEGPGTFLQGGLSSTNIAPGPFTYQWSPCAGMLPPNCTLPNPYVRPDTTTIYTLVITDQSTGCTSQTTTLDTISTTTVHVNPLPVVEAGPDTIICLGETVQLTGFASQAGPQYTYIWTPNDPSTHISDSTILSPTVSPDFTTTFFLVSSSNGCLSHADSVTVTVQTLPTTSGGPRRDICLGDSVLLNGLASGDPTGSLYTYQWMPAAGLSDPNSATPMASPASTTSYYLQAGTARCFGFVDTIEVEVKPTAIAAITSGDTVICTGDTIKLSGTHSFTTTPVSSPVVYEWSPAQYVDNKFATSPMAFPPQTMFYTLTVTVAGDCPTTDQVRIEVSPDLNAEVQADTTTICSGDAVGLYALGGLGSPQYNWSPTTGLSDATVMDPVATPEETTTYYVLMQEGKCSGMDSITIKVHPSPEVDYLTSQTNGCAPLSVNFLDNTENGLSLIWDFGDGTVVTNEPNPIHLYPVPGVYEATLSVVGVGGCRRYGDTTRIVVKDNSFADFESNPDPGSEVVLPEGEVLFGDLSVNAINWLWDFGDGNTSGVQHPVHIYREAGEYYVTLSVNDENGCISEITYGPYMVLEPDLLIPNVFTPNGDGINDGFGIIYTGKENFELAVFDRWGTELFRSYDPADLWDGTNTGGSVVKEGVYFYSLQIGEKAYNGNVTLLR